ncbi:MAG: glycosyltransferase [Spirochaetaceae bacterium]|nr:glycosyltransferase [Spirochaetaceae bacterium]
MKILLLNYSDTGAGAAIAAERLLIGLRQNNIDVELGVVEKKTINPAVISLGAKSFYDRCRCKCCRDFCRIIERVYKRIKSYIKKIIRLEFHTTNTILHSENKKSRIDIKYINNSKYDLIHLHWINHDMISIADIARIKKPIIWTMHDCWTFSGAEHHPNVLENDNRFMQGYTKKNKPKSTHGSDICRKTWERKKKYWTDSKFNFISPSNFEKDAFYKSALFQNSQSSCTVIPNIIPENIFKPVNKQVVKELYQIPSNKKVIGFGAAYDITNKKSIKGGHLLIEALKKISKKSNYYFVIFGNDNLSFINEIGLSTFATGFISNPYILSSIYNLCDVFVCPSLVENLPNVCLESLFCGIPVAAFNTGGIPDIVKHKKTGYLASCFDTEDLFNGIMYCIDNYDELSRNALAKAQTEFDNEIILKKHIELYESILKKNN